MNWNKINNHIWIFSGIVEQITITIVLMAIILKEWVRVSFIFNPFIQICTLFTVLILLFSVTKIHHHSFTNVMRTISEVDNNEKY